jgi:hypothetical protein
VTVVKAVFVFARIASRERQIHISPIPSEADDNLASTVLRDDALSDPDAVRSYPAFSLQVPA